MSQTQEERREFQRLSLDKPIAARLGDADAQIVDLGMLGARVEGEHGVPSGSRSVLRFESARGAITLECEIVHRVGESHAGLRFISAPDGSDVRLRQLLADLVTAAIQRLRPTAGEPQGGPRFDPEQTAMRIPAPYLSLRLESGIWRKRSAFIPIQPDTGFTVPVTEDSAEISRLSEDYERSGEEGRRLIRLFAELRVCESLRVLRA